jgi:hypothetical protein
MDSCILLGYKQRLEEVMTFEDELSKLRKRLNIFKLLIGEKKNTEKQKEVRNERSNR